MVGHERLALCNPDAAQVGHVLALLLKRLKVFFCVIGQAGTADDPLRTDAPGAGVATQVQPSVRVSSDPVALRFGAPARRGLENMKILALLTATAINLKRMAKATLHAATFLLQFRPIAHTIDT